MTAQDRINQIQKELADLQRQQEVCQHLWRVAFYDPYEVREPRLTGRYETHGIHHDPILEYHDVTKDRWTRVCYTCGKREHTEKQVNISTPSLAPNFG